jgi:hypothetical protein
MIGEAIAAQALGHAGLRRLPTEFGGPRPAAVRPGETVQPLSESRTSRATRP